VWLVTDAKFTYHEADMWEVVAHMNSDWKDYRVGTARCATSDE